MKRFAIYFAPPAEAPLTRVASSWLGRDAFWNFSLTPPLNGFSRELWRAATSEPRLYGFHATLKPPFRLVYGRNEEDLRETLALFAASRNPFDAPPLHLGAISSFLALTLSAHCPKFVDLASDCVRQFDGFRAPPDEAELARRRRSKLTPVQLDHLMRWGYPYVMDEWRFHMTLTSSLEPHILTGVKPHLETLFAPFREEPIRVDSICLFEQPGELEPFRVVERFLFK